MSYNRLFWKKLITADANADVVAAKNTELPTFSLKLITLSSVWVNFSGALPGIVFNAGRNEIVLLAQHCKKSCIYNLHLARILSQYVLKMYLKCKLETQFLVIVLIPPDGISGPISV